MLPLVILAVMAIGIDAGQYGERFPRGSAGAFSGVSNGQFYGATYHNPGNGAPTVVNRFGSPPSSNSGSFPSPPIPFSAGSSYAPQFPFGPNVPPFQNPLEFNNFFQNYFSTLNDNLASAVKNNKPHSASSSSVSFSFDGKPSDGVFAKNFEFQRAAFEAAQKAFQATANNRFGNGNYGPNFQYGGGFGGAAASASFGPGGGHQAAGVYPQNPNNPNIYNRFGGGGGGGGGSTPNKGGTFGVSSSSFSASSDIGGKKTGYKEASTTINDNGKITTHTVRS